MIAGSSRLVVAALLLLAGVLLSAGWPRPPKHGRRRAARSSSEVRGAQAPNRLPALAAVAVAALAVVLEPRLGAVAAPPLAGAAWWAAREAVRRSRGVLEADAQLPLALDLAAAALRSGLPVADALELAAPAAPRFAPELTRAAGLLRLGAEPHEAWAGVADGPLAPMARIAIRSDTSGVRLAAAIESLASQLRADLQVRGLVRAHRAGVLALAPLGACFLPAFVCLGIVPVVVGIARSVNSAIP